jgi:AraC family transcriptional regulator
VSAKDPRVITVFLPMTSASPLPIDFSQERSSLRPDRPFLQSSHSAGWQNITLIHKFCPPLETPEFQPLQHVVEINLSPNARGECRADGRLHTPVMAYGAAMIAPAFVNYQLTNSSAIESISIFLDPEFVAHTAYEAIDPDRVELTLCLGAFDPLIYGIGSSLKAELESGSSAPGFYVESLANTLATHLLRKYTARLQPLMVEDQRLAQYTFAQVVEYVDTYLDRPMELNDLAEIAGMSRFYFCRLFKQTTGTSPYQYVIQQRVERAKQLLTTTSLGVSEIASACGFANQSHLTRYFKRITQVTPTVFRTRSQ